MPPAQLHAMAAMAAMGMGGASVTPVAGVGYAGFRPSAAGGPQAVLSNVPPGGGKDKSRPVSSTAVAGTPWCVVWTGDNRVIGAQRTEKTEKNN